MTISIDAPSSTQAAATPHFAMPLLDPHGSEPIRAELFGLDRLDAYARELAGACVLAPPHRAASPLLRRFGESGRVLARVHRRIIDDPGGRERRSLDAEWLVDNFHIVDDVLREIRQDLPPGYDEELPKLATPPAAGYPRVYALALALVAHNDSELDDVRIGRFLHAFQDVAALLIGELWAVPTMLRLVLVENLRRLADQMIQSWDDRKLAEEWAAQCQLAEAQAEKPPIPTLSDAFVLRAIQLLRDQGSGAASALQCIEAELLRLGVEPNEILRREHQRQAANQVTIGNCVTTLRLLSTVDWNDFFERHSVVEFALREDPANVYSRQDFPTRDRYRRAVEHIARRSSRDEREVARRAIALATAREGPGVARQHVGYYIVGPGAGQLKHEVRFRPTPGEWLRDAAIAHPEVTYFGSVLTLLTLLAIAPVAGLQLAGIALRPWQAVLIVLAILLPLSELAVGLVNQLITLLLPPRVLPKLDFRAGIAADCATIVVMPSMLIRPESASVLLGRLEIHYLANPDPGLRFALLTDFADAPAEHAPEDDAFIESALEGVRLLNARYATEGSTKFFLFHRRRLWNCAEGCWMGWERKRGKLSEFNRLLRGDKETSYAVLSSDPAELRHVRFVITLDADTQMPKETAARLVGTLAHPLNLPRFDPAQARVVEGHGVLQPRVSFHLVAATRSRFARLLGASAGIDPYSTAVSDHYMDLFGTGSFTGKGIYDVDAFEAATGAAFPENHILSHDLIEGNFARCGLASDIELFDDFPARYHAYARREHRWVRGDWQLLPWLGRRVPSASGPRRNPLPLLERWKLFDNLRRSLVPPAIVLLLVLGWMILPGSAWPWTVLGLAMLALPILQMTLTALIGTVRTRSMGAFKAWRERFPSTAGQVLLSMIFLADQAYVMLDAIIRTLNRLLRTRRLMLEWETAASTEGRLGNNLRDFYLSMWPAPALAAAVAVVLGLVRVPNLEVAGAVLILWFGSPVVAYWVSRPYVVRVPALSDEDRLYLRRLTRRTWHFFETFVGDEDNWLPPDNFQEIPEGRIAHRTSPTNQGLLLLSTLAAHDLGYLGLRSLVERLENTFATFDRLNRYRGHFFNWYDTQTLQPLPPQYVSTVDSGNLLGCLVALKHGLRERLTAPLISAQVGSGLHDTLGLALEVLQDVTPAPASAAAEVVRELRADLTRVGQLLGRTPRDLLEYEASLGRLEWATLGLLSRIEALKESAGRSADELDTWVRMFAQTVRDARSELSALAPWLSSLRAWESQAAGAWPSDALNLRWRAVRASLVEPKSLAGLIESAAWLKAELEALESADPAGAGLRTVALHVEQMIAGELSGRIQTLIERAEHFAASMDFRFLYKPERQLFAIGCNLVAGRLDGACYDLLASEASLTSFLTIARGEAPRRHWFQLNRPYTRVAGRIGLLSWGGTMFEYLMPRLLLQCLPGTILPETNRTAVLRQIEYGRQLGIPWGISESAFAAQYADGDYQYQSFGVPGLGLKRGLGQDLVVAPYATALALMIEPRESLENFERLAAEGAEGPYGFYEAVDFTPERRAKGRRSVVVRSFMAHHQGMSLVALANALLDDPMPSRFRAEPMVRAAELLLQERVPPDAPLVSPSDTAEPPKSPEPEMTPSLSRKLTTPHTAAPRTHLLSNSQYTVMVTNAGGGFSTCRGLDVTRWREDFTCDAWGQFCYIRDLANERVWAAGFHPIGVGATDYEVVFSADKATFRRFDSDIETLLEIAVSPEQLVECRRITVTNRDTVPRELEFTSYAEIVLNPRGADLAHPAFGKLFLETEWVPSSSALLCRRRPRAHDQHPVWGIHVIAVDGQSTTEVQFETERARFLGRGRTPADPAALDGARSLSGTTGPVLDPIVSLRRRIRLEPRASAVVAFSTGVADTRDAALALADQFCATSAVARVFELAWAHSQVEQRHHHWSPEDTLLFQRLAAPLIYAGSAHRAPPDILMANRLGQSGLWREGISGDKPILVATIRDPEQVSLARQVVAAHAYLRIKGFEFDLVLLNEQATTYRDELNQQLLDVVRASASHDLMDKPGGVFVRRAGGMAEEDRCLLLTAARVVLRSERGSLSDQLERVERIGPLPPTFPRRTRPPERREPSIGQTAELQFSNGLGGFGSEGREYHIYLRGPDKENAPSNGALKRDSERRVVLPPAPWINVVANPSAGFLVSESGLGYTWVGNSQTNRLTPWNNDPVSDPPGEAIYLRDDESGEYWSATPLPIQSDIPTRVRHGQGYTVFEQQAYGLFHELTVFVPPDDPIKLIRLIVRNTRSRARRLSATYFAEWVLGTTRDQASMHVVTNLDPETGALLARNSYRADFSTHVAFADVDRRPRSVTADRTEFLGRNGSVVEPAAMGRSGLSGRVGAALDPCAAIQVRFELAPGEETTIVYALGEAENIEAVRGLVRRYRHAGGVDSALNEVTSRWRGALEAVRVRTPNPGMDLMLNHWLLYQVLSCRFWGRSAFYQSGGAYGFRDQLQDVMALVYGSPGESRKHILRAASRQFIEGDVQHWWHPPAGRGVRTRFSDDFLWLPFVVAHYVRTTGDAAILDERIHYLKGPLLKPEQEEDFGQPVIADESGPLYEHCLRALDHGMRLGVHGLPLMGTGDWNDGMNRVGFRGRGESVWDAWFLITCQQQFARLADARGDTTRAEQLREHAKALRASVEQHAWDGSWYRRAYFDDGTPLGSAQNDECQIDSIAQTWSVISSAGDPERARQAMLAVEQRLVRDADRLILLFTPPFDHGVLEPGYIKGYVPGIRENGGQYTHAATWVVLATALLGQGRRATELFDLLNPVHHAEGPEAVARYKVEPYVVAADVYGQAPHTGRGGWTWYTGSASWFYRVGLESILGFRLQGELLSVNPCIPSTWPGFELWYRRGSATYSIVVENPNGVETGVATVTIDGADRPDHTIPLADDGREHQVRILMG
jgi:cyclic beta-1,2-glucan synthetase